jgi:lysophospholipase L1-like esterase
VGLRRFRARSGAMGEVSVTKKYVSHHKPSVAALLRFAVAATTAGLAKNALAVNAYNIMPVGDSITAGYEDNPTWTYPYSYGYRADLYGSLETNFNAGTGIAFNYVGTSAEPLNGASGNPTSIATNVPNLTALGQDNHEGYSGVGTAYTLAHIQPEIAINSPNIILLMIGINDISEGSTAVPTAAEANLNSIFQTVFADAPNADLIVAQITPYSSYTPAIVTYNNYIVSTAASYAALGDHISTVNQYANFQNSNGSINTSLYANGINHPTPAAYAAMAQTWYNGIQALNLPRSGPATVAPPAPPNLIYNGGFEVHGGGANTHNVDPSGQGWNFTSGVQGAGSGIDVGPAGPYATNFSSYMGEQMAFIQGSGNGSVTSMSQAVSGFVAGQKYTLSFESKGIAGFLGADPFKVQLIDGNTDVPLFGGQFITPSLTGYTDYTTSFTATDTTETLDFYDAGLNTVQEVSWIDQVDISPVPEPGTISLLLGASVISLSRRGRKSISGRA